MLGVLHLAPAWTGYFAVVGISKSAALTWMTLIGALDVTMGLAVLLYPVRGIILWMAIWGVCTAILRPLAGEPIWEAVERAGNYGVPIALFLLAKGGSIASWLKFDLLDRLDAKHYRRFCWILRMTTVLLLLGHGALNLLVRKPVFATQYAMIGFHGVSIEPYIGAFECLLALAVLCWPALGLLLFVVAWKLATELLFPMGGSPIWVFTEHGGSYAAPLALALLERKRASGSVTMRPISNAGP